MLTIRATTPHMKNIVARNGPHWRRIDGLTRYCTRPDPMRDFVVGDLLVCVVSHDGRDMRWVAERNLLPLDV